MKLVKAILKSLLTVSFTALISTSALFAQGNALTFGGTTSAQFTRPVSDDFTIEFWFASSQIVGNGGNWYNGAGLVDGEVSGVDYDFGVSLTNGSVTFGTGESDVTITSGNVADGKWHHVAAVRTMSTGEMRLYVDGVLSGTAYGNTNSLTAPTNLTIGKLQTDLNYFIGMMDEVRIWNKPLSESEILAGIDHEIAGNTPNLAAYWQFNESSGSTLADSSGNGLNLTISGNPVFVVSGAFEIPLPKPTNLTINNSSLSSVQFSWDAISNPKFDHYNVYANINAGGNTLIHSTASRNPNDNTYSIGNVAFGSQYFYVTGVDTNSHESEGSNSININFDEYSAGLQITDFSSSSVTFTWNKSTAPDFGHYNLYIDSLSNPTVIGVSTTEKDANDNSYTFNDLNIGDKIYFRITEVDTLGNESSYSAELFYSQSPFSEYNADLSSNYDASTVWGDYDNDGDLDLLIAGEYGIIVYSNDNFPNNNWKVSGKVKKTIEISGRFLNYQTNLGNLNYGSATWFDSDNDGDLDIIAAGQKDNNQALSANSGLRLFKNNGEGFDEIYIDDLDLYTGTVTYGDYDGDGDLDLFVTGEDNNTGSIAYLYKNEGNNNFTRIDKGFPGVYRATADFVDYDQDGDLDLFYAGPMGNENGPAVELYKNDGTGNFTEVPASTHNLYYMIRAISDWADYDNDGDLDLLIAGTDRNDHRQNKTLIFKNNGDDSFTPLETEFEGVVHGSVAWGDYDNDGDFDIVASGDPNGGPDFRNSGYTTSVYRNDGNDIFTYLESAALQGITIGSGSYSSHYSAFGDFDNDGDLDFVISGETNDGNTSILYENNYSIQNNAPTAPSTPVSTVNKNSVSFAWEQSTDDLTNSDGLSYNVALMREDGSIVVSPLSNLETGYRLIAKNGNGTEKVRRLLPGKYYWKVQAIDAAFKASEFSVADTFVVTSGLPSEAPENLTASTNSETNNVELNWDASNDQTVVYYRIYRGTESNSETLVDSSEGNYYENLELLNNTVYYFKITAVDTAGLESDYSAEVTGKPAYFNAESTSLPGYFGGNVQLGDFDKDGDLDVLVSGYDINTGWNAKIFENNGNGFNFNDNANASFTFSNYGSSQFADLNNDGYLDVIISGANNNNLVSSNQQLRIYINENVEGSRVFNELSNHGVEDYSTQYGGSVSWGDYNRDGRNDIFVTGRNDSGTAIARLFKNNGDGTFSPAANFDGVWQSTSSFVDYNNDGWPDIFYSGAIGSQNKYAALYKNNGNGTFSLLENTGITSVARPSSSWADYDHDGDQDLLLTGYNASHAAAIASIFKNNGDGTFTDIQAGIEPVSSGSATWGDFDNDGDFDVFITGEKSGNPGNSNPNVTSVYRNNGNDSFTYFPENLIPLGNKSSITVGDIDNDGDLDFIASGSYNTGGRKITAKVSKSAGVKTEEKTNEIIIGYSESYTQVYSNPATTSNTKPVAPDSVKVSISSVSNKITVSWNPSSDNETTALGLSYNVSIIPVTEGNDAVSSLSDSSTGMLYLPSNTNSGQANSITFKGIPEGNYFVSVQAVDPAFGGSVFSEPVSLNLVYTVPVELALFEADQVSPGAINLKWKTASETNNSGWEIEMRGTGNKEQGSWKKVGFVAGKGTTSESHEYSFQILRLASAKTEFRLKQIDLDGKFTYSKSLEVTVDKPATFALGQNYPNPFNPKTIIPYSVPNKVLVSIKLYDILGRELKTLENQEREAGNYFIEFNAGNLSSGVYIYKIEAGSFSSTKKLFLMK